MRSLMLCSYVQPVAGPAFRWGVVESSRDTEKDPLSFRTILGPYRRYDKDFERSRNYDTLLSREGYRCLYRERQKWRIVIPFVGSLVRPFLKS